jgi:hypothetical protein
VTNQQLLLTIGLPMILIFVGILLNERNGANLRADLKEMRGDIKDVRSEVREVRTELVSRIDRIDSDLANFYKVLGVLEGRVDELSKR